MKNINNIEQLAQEAAKKNSWIRKALEDFFAKWKNIDFGGEDITKVVIEGQNGSFGLSTQNDDAMICYEYDRWQEYSSKRYFYEDASIADVREYLQGLPDAIREIAEELKEQQEFEIPAEIEAFLK